MERWLIAYTFGNSKKKKRIEKETSRRYGEMRAALDECARASKIGFLDSTVNRPPLVIPPSPQYTTRILGSNSGEGSLFLLLG